MCATLVGVLDSARASDPPPPPNVPAVDAYVEMVPTAAGPAPVAGGTPRVKRLPPHVRQVIRKRGGKQAPTLIAIATSSQYGAPTRALPAPPAPQPAASPKRPVGSRGVTGEPRTTPGPIVTRPATRAPRTTVRRKAEPVGSDLDLGGTLLGPDSGRVLGLGAIILAITLAGVGARVLRRSP